jgi:hypothetical protein
MFHGCLDYFPKIVLEGRLSAKLEDHSIITVDFMYYIMCEGLHE